MGEIVKRALERAGFDAARYGGQSLRAGFATQAAKNGATAFDIMRQTGHRSVQTVSRYVREAQIFRDVPTGNWDCEHHVCAVSEGYAQIQLDPRR